MSRSAAVPCTAGRGKDIFTTFKDGISNRFRALVSVLNNCATRSVDTPRATRSKASAEPQKMSMVNQNGPAFLLRTFSTTSLSLVKAHLLHIQTEGLHRIVQGHHMVQTELENLAPLDLGGRKGKGEGRLFFGLGQRVVQQVRV